MIQPLVESHLQRVVLRPCTRLDRGDVGEEWVGPQVHLCGTRRGLVDVTGRNEIAPARTHVGDFHQPARAQLLLHADVPVVHVGAFQIALHGGRRVRQRHRKVGRKGIEEREKVRRIREREERAQIEVRRVEVQELVRRERRLIVRDGVAAADDGGGAEGPGGAEPRREVVAVRQVAGPRHPVRTGGDELARRRVVQRHPVSRVHRRRVELVAQAGRQRERRQHADRVLHEQRVAVRPQVLRVVHRRAHGDGGEAQQQIRQGVAGERLVGELQQAA